MNLLDALELLKQPISEPASDRELSLRVGSLRFISRLFWRLTSAIAFPTTVSRSELDYMVTCW